MLFVYYSHSLEQGVKYLWLQAFLPASLLVHKNQMMIFSKLSGWRSWQANTSWRWGMLKNIVKHERTVTAQAISSWSPLTCLQRTDRELDESWGTGYGWQLFVFVRLPHYSQIDHQTTISGHKNVLKLLIDQVWIVIMFLASTFSNN